MKDDEIKKMIEDLGDVLSTFSDFLFKNAHADLHIKLENLECQIEGSRSPMSMLICITSMIQAEAKETGKTFDEVVGACKSLNDIMDGPMFSAKSQEEMDVMVELYKQGKEKKE